MKKILLLAFMIIANLAFSQKVTFKIIKDKTEVDNIGAIILHVEVINKSKNDITILKPATDFNQKWRYYDVEIDCSNIPLWSAGDQEMIDYEESDLLVIPAKSKVEIIINGRKNANMLACDSRTFQLKLFYDAKELINRTETGNLNSDEIQVVKKLTPIRIESKKTSIVMN
ncbi:hypothetical protein [Sphingobacterium paucimobilis]|uniref:Uncharacterized protein n=1 Tax=Sphingobacterium paucimobilis HER1398 TaxID=1346330 RepID=U2HDN1_9SPHI|nr:hypothetical protein [Sphingobacterium paucimobilis]ERJ59876.1 hypothetical protein M472_13980 [Sphingobacterium paucimobilis HER1398]